MDENPIRVFECHGSGNIDDGIDRLTADGTFQLSKRNQTSHSVRPYGLDSSLGFLRDHAVIQSLCKNRLSERLSPPRIAKKHIAVAINQCEGRSGIQVVLCGESAEP